MEIIGGTIKGSVIQKSQYELDKEKDCPLRGYIREIVREEIAAREERLIDDVKKSLHSDVTDFLAVTDGILRGTSE
ncbi:hypothetical protein [Paenibacillus bouchesdurhonensis]|uniref:hypothetical protein n=1 Tax=Paenibacillus bouchesdurhonensis TaxID=1870990 RepID=UPI000DA611F1|nr:hypothetical protein [Paenibacillus bouchesdurhonensis]